jgi:hypothetical protein
MTTQFDWQDAQKWTPDRPKCVLAYDGESFYIGVFENDRWWNAHLDEEIDSVITHWKEIEEPADT